ncbi:hypothetical protein EJ08DRAFT_481734 [Tothia fuscella]|uniref:CENP-V/GFA domain-containing protein n=1 Tax=Tothia fuscella TaxID=1048955 RepID=A0A9P4NI85_9PEZI|nr:hypothetical protein EJ08DRAFT_481734 [Tothia fuscella]
MSSHPTQFTRRPYKGSCHCGTIKYITYLTLPFPDSPFPSPDPKTGMAERSGQRLYKCNCTVCHKMGILHLRLQNPPTDFLLLSSSLDPMSPEGGISDYTCNKGSNHRYFCANCGVRCFSMRGPMENAEVEVDGKVVKVWRPVAEGWREGKGAPCYLSINAVTLEEGPEGLDLREWHDNGWVKYVDSLDDSPGFSEKP